MCVGRVHRYFAEKLPVAESSAYMVSEDVMAPMWNEYDRMDKTKRLKVGMVSSDFGVHPVATLMRGFIQYIDTSSIEV
jgi:predicted O-linked N-acetylglucosamine transferase (SPINDLY family)